MRRILIFTGSRSEWGYLRPVLEQFNKFKLKSYIVVTNMHVDPKYNSTASEIESDGFIIDERIPMNVSYESKFQWAYELGLLSSQIASSIERSSADLILIAGDRAETMAFATIAFYTNIPICHIQAGEKSGHKDGSARHAIGKLAHVHFASNEDAKNRLILMGEEDFRIHNVGAPQLDDLLNKRFITKGGVSIKKLGLDKNFVLIIFHNTVEDSDHLKDIIKSINFLIQKENLQQIWILPNSDAGSEILRDTIVNFNRHQTKIIRNLPRNQFAYLLSNCTCLIGNSSAGIIEAPALGKWSINIGHRQNGRYRSSTVIDLPHYDEKTFLIKLKETKKKVSPDLNYGNGASAKKICNILSKIKINDQLISKTITI